MGISRRLNYEHVRCCVHDRCHHRCRYSDLVEYQIGEEMVRGTVETRHALSPVPNQ